jgi:8-oxo-dGTP pyrophosphatase MutT (NUDIX family)
MWLMTTIGFFSAVQKPGTDFLTVRARVKTDLDRLREKYLPALSATIAKGGTDYPWRATVSHEQFAAALAAMVMDVHYANFKDEVAKKQGKTRASRYGQVWSALYDMVEDGPQASPQALPWCAKLPPGKKVAYGGVVVDTNGLVLLREPKNHFDGYVWTFAKGRPDPGETPQATALREVKEETGVDAKIVGPLPGEFAGGTTINRYFIMQASVGSGGVAPDDPETASIKWLSVEDAKRHIEKTANPTGRHRDQTVLAAAVAYLEGR